MRSALRSADAAAEAPQPSELLIYGEIGESFWDDSGTTASDVAAWLESQPADATLSVRINSPGGDVFDGITMYNLLRSDARRVVVSVDGTAISAASVVAMAGDEIRMAENALMMIHDPWLMTIGNAADLRETADVLDKIADASIATTYVRRTGLSRDAVREMMAKETWMDAAEALDLGFATHVDAAKSEPAKNLRAIHVAAFQRPPERVAAFLRPAASDATVAYVRRMRERRETSIESPGVATVEDDRVIISLAHGSVTFADESIVSVCEDGTTLHIDRNGIRATPPADERGGDSNPKESQVNDTEFKAALDKVNAELTDAKAKIAAFETQNAKLVTERDEALAKASVLEDQVISAEVDALIGIKISAAERDDYVALRKLDKGLFDKMVAQRAPMSLLQRDPIGAGPNPQPEPVGPQDDNGTGFAKLVNAAANG